MRRSSQTNKELTAIRSRTAIRHGQNTLAGMFERRMEFILEFSSVDTLSAHTGAGRIASLDHEAWDYTVEDDAVVLSCFGECCEVFGCLNGIVSL